MKKFFTTFQESRLRNKGVSHKSLNLKSLIILSAFMLFVLCSYRGVGQSISRTQIISNAVPYTTYTFTAASSNIKHGVSCSGVGNIITPSWVTTGSNTSMPYCWGGFSTLASFTTGLTNGKSAGDDDCTTGGDASESCALGVDCSGFVSRTWGRASKESTSSLPNISTALSSASLVQPGDIFNHAGSHVRLVETNYANGNYRVIESSANGWHVAYHTYTASQLSSYTPRKYVNVTNTASCGTPSSLTASSVTSSSVVLNWSVISGAVSYNVQYKPSSSSTWTTVTATATSQSISGLSPSTSYQFQVQAVCSSAGSYSSAVSFTTLPSSTPCGIPAGLSSSSITSSSAMLSWTAVSGAVSYNVQYKPSTSSTWITISSTTVTQSISGLSASTSYQFQIQAVCSSTGVYSSAASFTTLAATSTGSTITIGTASSAYSAHPFGSANSDERSEYIITKAELTASGWSSSASFLKSIAFNVSNAATAQPLGNFSITIAHTSAASFTSSSFLTGADAAIVYSGIFTAAAGWNTFNFGTPFAYDGTSNLLITICWDNSSFSANSAVLANSYSNYVGLYYRANISSGGVCSQTTGTQSYYRPNAKLVFSSSASMSTFEGGQQRSLVVPAPSDLNAANQNDFEVFPNPLDGTALFGRFADAGDKKMTAAIYDMLGRAVFSKEIVVEGGEFSLSFADENLKSGIYLFVGISDSKRFTKRIVVKK